MWTKQRLVAWMLSLVVALGAVWTVAITPAWAGLNDDRFDGNIFALYAGNGSLVPPRVTLADSLKREDKPTLLVFFIDDSSDCKQYSSVVSQLQAFYGRAVDFIPISVDSLPPKASFEPTEPGYYYKGVVPQTIVFNQAGQIVLDAPGRISFEQVDDVFRQVFDLLPRSESAELRRRMLNEVNTELAK